MLKKNKLRIAVCVLLAVTVLTAFAAMAGSAGSQSDPLVTLSYLTETFTQQIMDQVDSLLAERDTALRHEIEQTQTGGVGGTYEAVTLRAGETLYGEAGCEVLFRGGAAKCGATLVDSTAGGTLGSGGTLQVNHLYLMPADGGVTASAETTLLVRGGYSVK